MLLLNCLSIISSFYALVGVTEFVFHFSFTLEKGKNPSHIPVSAMDK